VAIVPGATSGTAKFKAVAYADSAGAPGSLLSSGTEVVGCTSGSTLTGALITPQSLTAGTPCWIGLSPTHRLSCSRPMLGPRVPKPATPKPAVRRAPRLP